MIDGARQIETQSYAKVVTPTTFGKPPRLEWLAINSLVIDPEYQREITGQGRTNVRRIAMNFCWSMFTPVVVASVGSSTFAIVDGQHRTTAAALCGIDRVPCAIIEAKRGEQAAAFSAINGRVTKLTTYQLYHAAVVAGEVDALAIADVCRRADVVVVKYPKPWNLIAVGETNAPKRIGAAIARFGRDCVVTALRAIRETGDGNAGMLRGPIVFGVAEVLHDHKEWRESGSVLISVFDDIDLGVMLDEASAASVRLRGSSLLDQFESRLVAALERGFSSVRKRK